MKTVRIFLSSPGDVAEERAAARDLLLGLARGPFVRERVLIDVVSWDDPHGGATMDARFTPQQAVDRSLPMPAECDLTIVLLWGRMGTPLTERKPDGTLYLSGTEWEFDNALVANKPVLVYRRTERVLIDADAPDADEKLQQKRRVDQFFRRFVGEGGTIQRATATYSTVPELLARLRQDVDAHLSRLLDRADADDAAGGVERAAGRPPRLGSTVGRPPDVPVAYREWVKKQYGGVDLLGLKLKKARPPSLSAIYVPQTATAAAPSKRTARPRYRPVLLLNRMAKESLYVSGAPGTGKSTLCRWVAWLVAEGTIPSMDVAPPPGFKETLYEGLKGRLPVLIRLREFWEYLPARVGASFTVSDLEDAIAMWVDKKRPDGLDGALLRAHLSHGSVLLLLDGMDEVPVGVKSAAGRRLPREQLLSSLADACPIWAKAGNRLLVTSRPYGLSSEHAARMNLAEAPLQPLPFELQQLLAHRWFAVLSADAGTGQETAADLFANIESQPWLVELASNPLLLTAMCIVFDEGKRLPQDKHELYERVVSTVLYSRYQDPADIDRVKRELGVIAYGMHTDGRTTPTAEATFHEIERWLQEYQEHKGYTERWEAAVFDTREALLSHSGLLVSSGDHRAGFAHLSFQEFFAAQRMFTVNEDRLADVFLRRASTPEWRNTLSFLFARILSASTEPKKALDLLQTAIETAGESDNALLLVLADAAQVLTGKGIALPSKRVDRLRDLLLKVVMTGSAAVDVRPEVGSALGRLGDPRFRPDRWWLPDEKLLGFIRIERGAFLMGSDPAKDPYSRKNDQPQHRVELPEYYIARYPVTVAQFRAFVEDTAFKLLDRVALLGVPNHPVWHLTFYEALRYCEWLSNKLTRADWTPSAVREQLTQGWVLTLPSEAEWEKAARGRDGRIYPWGDEESSSFYRGRVTDFGAAVGLFPEGGSPYGAMDMTYNVPEWTRSLWGTDNRIPSYEYPYDHYNAERHQVWAPETVRRVIRGAHYFHGRFSTECAARHHSSPGNPFGAIRLVLTRAL